MSTIIDLSTLTVAQGFSIQGDVAGDYAGRSVSSAGDINGDGIDDLVVGASNGDNGGTSAGEAYVIYGKTGSARGTVDLTGLAASDGFIIQGDAVGDYAGLDVSSAGDVNGDGINDLIVAASDGDNGGTSAGEAYVIYGKTGSARGTVDLTGLAASDGFIIQGDAAFDRAGRSVSNAGDVNGDGIADLIVGAPFGNDGGRYAGEAYIIYGKSGIMRSLVDLTGLAASDGFIIQGDVAGDRAGTSVSGAGDINGDGIGDLIVGSPRGDDGGFDAGEAYVIYGKNGNSRGAIDLTGLAVSDGFIVQGDGAGVHAGISVSSAGDINGDGIDDLILGADGGYSGYQTGRAYIIYGKSGVTRSIIDLTGLASSDGFIIQGEPVGDRAGNSVSNAGDVNGDGIDDLIVGAPNGNLGGYFAGQAYVIYGKSGSARGTVNLTGLAASDGFIIQGDEAGDYAGTSVSDAGDVNGDGIDDIIVGAPGSDLGGTGAGQAFIIYGSADLSPPTVINGTPGVDTLRGTNGNDIINALGSNDVLLGNNGNDVLNGGDGNDVLVGGIGNDILSGGTGLNELIGGGGDDVYIIETRTDSTVEFVGEGRDEVRTAFSIYGLQSNIENLTAIDAARHGALVGNALDNVITGNIGNDDLFGRAGNDTLRGGSGAANSLFGQEGDDIYIVEAVGDSLIEFANQGIDSVQTALASLVLRDHVENLTYTGAATFTGIGASGANTLTGGAGADFLSGLGGADILVGRSGADFLLGGAGADQYRYEGGEAGFDRITDFVSGVDKIALRDAGFAQTATFALAQGGTPVATTTNSTFLYNVNTGILSFDVDGTGTGAAVTLAQLNGGLTLAVGDFVFY